MLGLDAFFEGSEALFFVGDVDMWVMSYTQKANIVVYILFYEILDFVINLLLFGQC